MLSSCLRASVDSVTAVCQATNILQLKSPYEAHPTARSGSQRRSSLLPKATQANQSSEDLNLGYMDLNRFFSSFFGSLVFRFNSCLLREGLPDCLPQGLTLRRHISRTGLRVHNGESQPLMTAPGPTSAIRLQGHPQPQSQGVFFCSAFPKLLGGALFLWNVLQVEPQRVILVGLRL